MLNEKFSLSTVSVSTWVRTALMFLSFMNLGLQLAGKSILPISNEEISEIVSYIFTFVTSIITWWKNNSFTKKAQDADKTL